MKRSLEILLHVTDRPKATELLEAQGIEIAEARSHFIQVRRTTPTEVRRILKGIKLTSVRDGFRL